MLSYVVLSLFLGWLVIVSYYLFNTRRHYFTLISRTKKQRIDEILDILINHQNKNDAEIKTIKSQINGVMKDSTRFYQKMGMVRFNPFGRTEGDKSFVLSMLDGIGNGILLNFIYTHEGIRVYSKKVKENQGDGCDLSEEEKQAIHKAK